MYTILNAFFINFLTENSESENIIDEWKSENNQMKFKNLNKKPKVKKDIKKPKSAYIIFCCEERIKISRENEENEEKIKSDKIMKELGKRWGELKENNKDELNRYNHLSKKDKERYNIEIKEYVPCEESENEVKKKKNPSVPKGAKRAKGAYIFFCVEERYKIYEECKENGSSFSNKDIMREMGRRWKVLKEENKEGLSRYTQMAACDKKRHVNEMNTSKDKIKRDKKEDKKEDTHLPPKKVKTASGKKINGWQYYTRIMRRKFKLQGMSSTDATNELTRTWKELGKEGQQKWKDDASK